MTSEHDETVGPTPKLTLVDLQGCGYDLVLAQNRNADYGAMSTLLLNEAKTLDGAEETAHHRALLFLAKICSMMLTPSDKATPFRPIMQFSDGSRSFTPDDLSADDVELLAGLAGEAKNNLLRARFADLVWMKSRKKGIGFAHMAIDGYRAQPVTADTWHSYGQSCWHRALQLSLSIGSGAGERTGEIEQSLFQAFRSASSAQGYEPLWYIRPLYLERRAHQEAAEIAAQLEKFAQTRLEVGRTVEAFDFFDAAENWYERARQPMKQAEMITLAAGTWAARGDKSDSAILRQHCYTKAISLYRQVPAQFRTQYNVDTTIDALRTKLATAGWQALGEMETIKGPTIDLSDFADEAVRRVQGRSPLEALLAFCELHPYPDQTRLYEEAEEMASQSIVGQLFGGTTLARDGRAIARNEGSASSSAAHAAHVRSEAVKACVDITAMIAHGMIEPALDALQMEHNFSLMDFHQLTRLSPVVPHDRIDLVAKALHAGFCRDFVQAVHILVPQFEHIVRIALKDAGTHTTTHDEGIDMEAGLSTLVERAEMVTVFGENLTFTIRSIMCEQEGPNLRNAVAHGLADSALCNGKHGVYIWWLVLCLVVRSFAFVTRSEQPR